MTIYSSKNSCQKCRPIRRVVMIDDSSVYKSSRREHFNDPLSNYIQDSAIGNKIKTFHEITKVKAIIILSLLLYDNKK